MKFKSLWVALILCAIASQAQASIIFQTAAPNNVTANTLANANLGSHAAENFQLDSPDTIRQITFWGLYTPDDQFPSSFGFSITVYEDDAGLPADLTFAMSKLDVLAVDATSLAYDYPPFNGEIPLRQFTVSLVTPVVIPDTQTYWLEITAFNSPDHPFFWAGTGNLGGDGYAHRSASSFPYGPWMASNSNQDLSVILYNQVAVAAVPEPATMGLTAFSVGSLLLAVRRRRA